MEEEWHQALHVSLSSPRSTSSSSSSLLRDICNIKAQTTPRNHPLSHPPSPYSVFFTASKQTPATASAASSIRRCPPSSLSRKKAARRLRAFEIEQSFSSRKVQIKKEKTLHSLEHQPMLVGSGKRESLPGEKFEIGRAWRNPKRLKNRAARSCSDAGTREAETAAVAALRVSLKDVCSLEDLKDRLSLYMSADDLRNVLLMMSHVSKTIDDGRLKMKSHCPLASDVAMREKAIKVLMSYNPTWLRIGLHIVFGGDSILPGDLTSEDNDDLEEDLFVRMIVDKQFFSHAGLAKSYAYNKSVEGNYRPGYYEALGSVILKRFLLFVLCLDKAKCQNSLPLRYGIDGLDGGSPLLFQKCSLIKSSRQVIIDFLMETMHGEGDLLSRLATLGYKVSYQQVLIAANTDSLPLLAEYDFVVANLVEDFRDGVRLCRIVQFLQHDASILAKVVVPFDNRKKKLHNCSVAMQYLKQAGVPLVDDDGDLIMVEDIVGGDNELILALLWNTFIHLQLPLLVSKDSLLEELSNLNRSHMVFSGVESMSHVDILLVWIQVICKGYNLKVNNFASLVDGKALVCLIDYYLRAKLHREDGPGSSTLLIPYCDDALQNFDYVQRVNTRIGRLPEVLQRSDILDQDLSCNERNVLILAMFLSSLLIGRKNMDQINLQQVLRGSPLSSKLKPPGELCKSGYSENNDMVIVCPSQDKQINILKTQISKCESDAWSTEERAGQTIMTHLRCFLERRKYLKIRAATFFLQTVVRAWLVGKKFTYKSEVGSVTIEGSSGWRSSEIFERYCKYMIERRSFLTTKRSVLVIQRAVRRWIRCRQKCLSFAKPDNSMELILAVILIQACIRGWNERRRCSDIVAQRLNSLSIAVEGENLKDQVDAAIKIQLAWRKWKHSLMSAQHAAAARIQSSWRGWSTRKDLQCQQVAAVKIQSRVRSFMCQQKFNNCKIASVQIQRCARACLARRKVLGGFSFRRSEQCGLSQNQLRSVVAIQRWWRKVLAPSLPERSAVTIQAHVRGWIARQNVRKTKSRIIVIQRWWKNIWAWKRRGRSAILIQSHVRRWIARRAMEKAKHRIIVIQSHWKGHLARRSLHLESIKQLLDLRIRMQKSAANVDNGMRLMNRLIDAHHTLAALLSSRKVTGILHTFETLDVATQLSQKCCETLAETGAVETLLQVFQIGNRSIPYVEVFTHALSTLRNLARYPHIVQVLIGTNGLLKTVLEELLWHKEEGYFIAAELLKKICGLKAGVEAIRSMPSFVRRLHNLAEDLQRKASIEKRQSSHRRATKYSAERRLGPAKDLLACIMNN